MVKIRVYPNLPDHSTSPPNSLAWTQIQSLALCHHQRPSKSKKKTFFSVYLFVMSSLPTRQGHASGNQKGGGDPSLGSPPRGKEVKT